MGVYEKMKVNSEGEFSLKNSFLAGIAAEVVIGHILMDTRDRDLDDRVHIHRSDILFCLNCDFATNFISVRKFC